MQDGINVQGEFFLKINKRACTSIRYTRVNVKSCGGLFQIFVAFLENLNFTNGTKFVIERVLIQTNLCACRPDLFHELSKLKAYFWGLH